MSWKADFLKRVAEIEGYFEFLSKLDGPHARLHYEDENGNLLSEPIDQEVLKTLRAASLLIMYNLVESAIKSAIETIYDDLKQKKVNFDDVRDELKQVAISNLRRNGKDLLLKQITLAADILTIPFKREELFSGNVDAKKIRETAAKYGFSSNSTSPQARGGVGLLVIKTRRNDLAHGDYSFSEVGRDFPVPDLVDLKTEVVAYLTDIVTNIEQYVAREEYLNKRWVPGRKYVTLGENWD